MNSSDLLLLVLVLWSKEKKKLTRQEIKNFDGGNFKEVFFISVCTILCLLRLNYSLFSGGECG